MPGSNVARDFTDRYDDASQRNMRGGFKDCLFQYFFKERPLDFPGYNLRDYGANSFGFGYFFWSEIVRGLLQRCLPHNDRLGRSSHGFSYSMSQKDGACRDSYVFALLRIEIFELLMDRFREVRSGQ